MAKVVPSSSPSTLAERFWSIAQKHGQGSDNSPTGVVRQVLDILDATERGEEGDKVPSSTLSFLAMVRQAERRGELGYVAPEQIRGEMADERSLVFSVGVLLFERLTGNHPFGAEGNGGRRLARIQKGQFGSGVNYFPEVDPGLRSILMGAMGPFPEERYATLRELRARLEEFLRQSAPPPRLPGTPLLTGKSDYEEDEPTTVVERPPAEVAEDEPAKVVKDEQTRVVDMGPTVQKEQVVAARRSRRKRRAEPDSKAAAGSQKGTDKKSSAERAAKPNRPPAPSVSAKKTRPPAPSASAKPSPPPIPSVSAKPSPSPAPSVSAKPSPSPAPSVPAKPSPSPAPSVPAKPSEPPAPSASDKPSPPRDAATSDESSLSPSASVSAEPSTVPTPDSASSDVPQEGRGLYLPARFAPFIWIGLGALLASVLFVLLDRPSGPQPVPEQATALAVEQAQDSEAAAGASADEEAQPRGQEPKSQPELKPKQQPKSQPELKPKQQPKSQPAAVVSRALELETADRPAASIPAKPVPSTPATVVRVFDPDDVGRRAARLIHGCMDEPTRKRGYYFGLAVLLGTGESAQRLYFGNDDRFAPGVRPCIISALRQNPIAVPASPRSQMLNFRFRISGDTIDVELLPTTQ